MMKYNLITVLGPTAGNKTVFAAHLAYHINGEIISADSRQVYRRMNLGTGKDYNDYIVNSKQIPYHLIDIAEPGYKYNVFEFQQDFIKAFRQIEAKNRFPVLCGGTGLYIDAVIKGYRLLPVPPDENIREQLSGMPLAELATMLASMKKLHNDTDIDTKEHAIRAIEIETYYRRHPEAKIKFPDISNLCLGIRFDRNTERRRITERLHARLTAGMIDEVEELLKNGMTPESLMYYGLEYKYITLYLRGILNYEQMFTQLNTAIHQFAKRQMTWFRKMEREGTRIHWIEGSMPMDEKIKVALQLLHNGG